MKIDQEMQDIVEKLLASFFTGHGVFYLLAVNFPQNGKVWMFVFGRWW